MCIPSPSIDQFIDAVKQIAIANWRWITPSRKGSLYIRPLLIGSGPILGLAQAAEYTFLVYSSSVGNYFKEGLSPLNFYRCQIHNQLCPVIYIIFPFECKTVD
ncbi:hypothetical protein CsSME_00040049 [Camellia sinensis var. sinensis]